MRPFIFTCLICVITSVADAQYVFHDFDINPTGASAPRDMTLYNGKLFFSANDGADGRELWVTDGTQAGTMLVADINPGGASSNPTHFIIYNNLLFFNATDRQGSEVWVSDGTGPGTHMVKDLYPGPQSSNPAHFMIYNNQLVFTADTVGVTQTIYVTDGTDIGTTRLKKTLDFVDTIVNYNGTLYFRGRDRQTTFGIELWISDLTAAGTAMFMDINPGPYDSDPSEFVEYNGKLYFSATTNAAGTELWSTNGTVAGTKLFKDINPGTFGSNPGNFKFFNGSLYFTAADPANGIVVRLTDGTAAGTILMPMPQGVKAVYPSMIFKDRFYINGNNPGTGTELYSTDGTAAGTQMVRDIYVGPNSGAPDRLIEFKNHFYFVASPNGADYKCYVSDGTDAGTHVVQPNGIVNFGPLLYFGSSYFFENFTVYDGKLYFGASFDAADGELWSLDDIDPAGISTLNEGDVRITVAPNPSDGNFSVVCPVDMASGTEITVVNITGQSVYYQKLTESKKSISLTLSGQPAGMYLLQMRTQDAVQTRKLIIR